MIGRTLAYYRLDAGLGAGGMGVVWRARDLHLERDVALTVLPEGALADVAARRRYHREALALSSLNHAHIATVFDFDTQEGVGGRKSPSASAGGHSSFPPTRWPASGRCCGAPTHTGITGSSARRSRSRTARGAVPVR